MEAYMRARPTEFEEFIRSNTTHLARPQCQLFGCPFVHAPTAAAVDAAGWAVWRVRATQFSMKRYPEARLVSAFESHRHQLKFPPKEPRTTPLPTKRQVLTVMGTKPHRSHHKNVLNSPIAKRAVFFILLITALIVCFARSKWGRQMCREPPCGGGVPSQHNEEDEDCGL